MTTKISVATNGKGLYEITSRIEEIVSRSGVEDGVCTIFVMHTSASLVIQENADPSAKRDLEQWLERLVPEGDPLFSHNSEGADDMPAHIKAALTQVSIAIPIMDGRLTLGTWQGIYLWEHRRADHRRTLAIHVQ